MRTSAAITAAVGQRASGAAADHPAALIERATLPEERVISGTLATLEALAREAKIAAPALLIVGEVAAFARVRRAVSGLAEVREETPREVYA